MPWQSFKLHFRENATFSVHFEENPRCHAQSKQFPVSFVNKRRGYSAYTCRQHLLRDLRSSKERYAPKKARKYSLYDNVYLSSVMWSLSQLTAHPSLRTIMFPGVFHSTRDVEFYSILKAGWKVFLKHHSELNPKDWRLWKSGESQLM